MMTKKATTTSNSRAVSSREMREIDRRAGAEYGIPVETLMENAGKAVKEACLRMMDGRRNLHAAVFCGGGNNGGDGFVASRLLTGEGCRVETLLLKPRASLEGAALKNFERLEGSVTETPGLDAMGSAVSRADVIVDAMTGTGFKGVLSGSFADAVRIINASGKKVLAVDIPSGMDADSGNAEGPCIRAHETVTMGALKKGFLNPGSKIFTGEVTVADIGFPEGIFSK